MILLIRIFKGKINWRLFTGRAGGGPSTIERSQKTKQIDIGFVFINFGPCGAQVEKDREGIKYGGRQKKCNLGRFCSLY